MSIKLHFKLKLYIVQYSNIFSRPPENLSAFCVSLPFCATTLGNHIQSGSTYVFSTLLIYWDISQLTAMFLLFSRCVALHLVLWQFLFPLVQSSRSFIVFPCHPSAVLKLPICVKPANAMSLFSLP